MPDLHTLSSDLLGNIMSNVQWTLATGVATATRELYNAMHSTTCVQPGRAICAMKVVDGVEYICWRKALVPCRGTANYTYRESMGHSIFEWSAAIHAVAYAVRHAERRGIVKLRVATCAPASRHVVIRLQLCIAREVHGFTALDMSGCRLSNVWVFALDEMCSGMPNMTSLSLSRNDLASTPACIQRLAAGLEGMAGLTRLDLGGNQLCSGKASDLDDLRVLAPALAKLGSLQEVNLSENWIAQLPTTLPSLAIAGSARWRHLDLSHNRIGIHHSVCQLTVGPNLRRLILVGNHIGNRPSGVAELAQTLARALALQHLDLAWNALGIHKGAMVDLAKVLPCTLLSLDLSRNRLGAHEGAIATIAGGFSKLESLMELNLDMNNIGYRLDDVVGLALGLAHLRSLTTLGLSGNRLGESVGAMRALVGAIGGLRTLRTLDLRSNNIGADPLTSPVGALVELLVALKGSALESLSLGRNPLGASCEFGLLTHALGGLGETLMELNLAWCWIGSHDGGVAALGAVLGRLPRLRTLDLDGNQLGFWPGAVDALAGAVRSMETSTLTTLELAMNMLDKHPGELCSLTESLAMFPRLVGLDTQWPMQAPHDVPQFPYSWAT